MTSDLFKLRSNSLYYFFNIDWKSYFSFRKRGENIADVQFFYPWKKILWRNCTRLKKPAKLNIYHIRCIQAQVKYSKLLLQHMWKKLLYFQIVWGRRGGEQCRCLVFWSLREDILNILKEVQKNKKQNLKLGQWAMQMYRKVFKF